MVDVHQLQQRGRAPRTVAHVVAHLGGGPLAQRPAGVLAEPAGVLLAALVLAARDVCLQEGGGQPGAGAVCLDGGRVGGLAEHDRDGLRRLLLDLGVPEQHPVVLGQFDEGLHHHALVCLGHRPGVRAGVGEVVPHRRGGRGLREGAEVVDQLLAPLTAGPGGGDVAHGRQQVGADGELGALAGLQGLQGAGEDLAGQVLGGEAVTAAGAGVAADGLGVPAVDLLVRGVVAGPDQGGQLGVGGRAVAVHRVGGRRHPAERNRVLRFDRGGCGDEGLRGHPALTGHGLPGDPGAAGRGLGSRRSQRLADRRTGLTRHLAGRGLGPGLDAPLVLLLGTHRRAPPDPRPQGAPTAHAWRTGAPLTCSDAPGRATAASAPRRVRTGTLAPTTAKEWHSGGCSGSRTPPDPLFRGSARGPVPLLRRSELTPG